MSADEPVRRNWTDGRPARVVAAIRSAALAEGMPPSMVTWRSNEANVVRARRRVMVELAAAGFSTPQIGRWLGGLHHTTVIHHLKRAAGDAYCKVPTKPFDPDVPDLSGEWAI